MRTLQIPDSLFERLQKLATLAQRGTLMWRP